MNLQKANFEDLLTTYYFGTTAHRAAQELGDLIQNKEHERLNTTLRHYRERRIIKKSEIEFRAATDRLLNFCSIAEIASSTGFVPELRCTNFGATMRQILENGSVRRYYEKFYPTKLPQLFLYRLAGINSTVENGTDDSISKVLVFLDLDRQFMEKLDDGILLRMLDSFIIEGYWFSDVVELIGKPKAFANCLLRAPKRRDVLSRALSEFSIFMQFCFDLRKFLIQSESQPLLQSMAWNHYSYWFNIIGVELEEQLGAALSQFLKWTPERGDADSVEAVQTYVREAGEVLKTLTSREFAAPVDRMLKSFRMQ